MLAFHRRKESRVTIALTRVDNPGVALNLPDGTEVSPSVLEVSNVGGGELGKWLLIGIAIGSFLIALGLAVLLKFLPLRARLILFLVVLIGSLIGGVFGTGHNFSDLLATIQGWNSG